MTTKPRSDATETKTGWVVKETLYSGGTWGAFQSLKEAFDKAALMKDPAVDVYGSYDDSYDFVVTAFRDATPEEIEATKAARASREKIQVQWRREQFEKLKAEFEGK